MRILALCLPSVIKCGFLVIVGGQQEGGKKIAWVEKPVTDVRLHL